ncbi:MAG: ATP-binding cassette domain-containing protein, partial [Candidatus Delongbacteria bacterium]|nr:ATP-binding cassette domain-containing protein [Candidatus Delongbacteria bacterium]
TNLSTSQHQVINRLSKGYRKRVALAQALLGDPKILILDEPFSGMDSFQMSDTRRLIRELAGDRIILLSSHILAEVDQLCSHLIIIDKGRIIADGSSETVIQRFLQTIKFRLTLSPLSSELIECLKHHPQIIRIDRIGESEGNQIEIETLNQNNIQQEIARIIQTHHAMVIEFIPVSNRLEDMYLQVIK